MTEAEAVEEKSSYLKYLPAIYSEDEFIGRFLKIFEDILSPIEGVIDNITLYLDPQTVPADLLPWLASWLELALDENWPLEKRRRLVGSAVDLYIWRGTKRGLREYLKVYTGVEPEIIEHFGGIKLHQSTRLGENTILGEGRDYCFTVTLAMDNPTKADITRIKAIIEAEKPAHTAYELHIVPETNSSEK